MAHDVSSIITNPENIDMDSSEYRFLYDGSRPNWILVTIDGREKIYNEVDHVILNSFAPDLESAIIGQMKKHG